MKNNNKQLMWVS